MVAACCAFAALLNLGLTKFDARFSVTYCDGHTELKSGPTADPIIPLSFSVADTFCRGSTSAPEKARYPAAFSTEKGLFARDFVPRILALSLGTVVPTILVLSAAFVALRPGRSTFRTISIVILAAFGFLTLVAWIAGMAMEFSRNSLRYLFNYVWPVIIPVLFLGGAYWLSRRPSSKEPS
jgi:hypothetical protein